MLPRPNPQSLPFRVTTTHTVLFILSHLLVSILPLKMYPTHMSATVARAFLRISLGVQDVIAAECAVVSLVLMGLLAHDVSPWPSNWRKLGRLRARRWRRLELTTTILSLGSLLLDVLDVPPTSQRIHETTALWKSTSLVVTSSVVAIIIHVRIPAAMREAVDVGAYLHAAARYTLNGAAVSMVAMGLLWVGGFGREERTGLETILEEKEDEEEPQREQEEDSDLEEWARPRNQSSTETPRSLRSRR
ncbi:hypothetical protein C8F01DRAFT_1258301 [Mycena amicta]|nr:hypothetical protein C8F01DRAFT_1258301 [Mycena amicta]